MSSRSLVKYTLAALLLPVFASSPLTPGTQAIAQGMDADARETSDQEAVGRGLGDLFQAAKSGHPSLLQDAEREVVTALLDGLDACAEGGRIDRKRYDQVLASYDAALHLFHELPYTLEVDPGNGQRPFSLSLRRHPWWDLSEKPPHGWQAILIESGARLVATNR